MNHYTHLTIDEREKAMVLLEQSFSIRAIARILKRPPSTVSREFKRNSMKSGKYVAHHAQKLYAKRNRNCGRNGPALVAVLGVTIITLAESIGVNPAVLLLGYAFFTTFSFTLPIDPISLVIYDGGANFNAIDMPKVGFPLVIISTIITAVWLPICAKLLGIM